MGDWSWSDVADDVKPRIDTVPIVIDGNLGAQLDEARAALRVAQREDTLDGSATADAQAEVDRLEALAEDATRDFTVRSIGYRRWRELVENHPSGDEGRTWDPETFIPAVLLEACDQFATEKDVEQALDRLATGQVARLFGKARLINEGDDRLPKSRGR